METLKYNSLHETGLKVTSSMTTPSRPGKAPRPVHIVSGLTLGYEQILRDLGGHKFRGQWSFWDDPSDDLLEQINRHGKLSFAESVDLRIDRKLSKAERYSGYADNAETRAERASETAQAIGQMIPMGQPILVGHHSESRHRRDIKRIDSNMRKSIDESKKAEYFEHKSASLEQDVSRILQSRCYIGNQIEKEEAFMRRLHRHPTWVSNFESRVRETQEKLDYWKSKLSEIAAANSEAGKRTPSPETVVKGGYVNHRGQWYPVVRVSKKSVTIGNWLGVATFTFRVPYTDLSDCRSPKTGNDTVPESKVTSE